MVPGSELRQAVGSWRLILGNKRHRTRRIGSFLPRILELESRLTPTVTFTTGFAGMVNTGWAPPDPSVAVGPNHVLESVNESYAIYNKSTGALLSKTLSQACSRAWIRREASSIRMPFMTTWLDDS
jgi:hypothetical protein